MKYYSTHLDIDKRLLIQNMTTQNRYYQKHKSKIKDYFQHYQNAIELAARTYYGKFILRSQNQCFGVPDLQVPTNGE